MRALMLLAALAMGCEATAEPVRMSDGRMAWGIRCEDAVDCVAKAGELCPSGYFQSRRIYSKKYNITTWHRLQMFARCKPTK